jgi:putative transposase
MKRHTLVEIAQKLRQAETLAASGQSQEQICKALGVSVMTFHRWRKSHPSVRSGSSVPPTSRDPASTGGWPIADSPAPDISSLRLENQRLRRIVTDLLLEEMQLQDTIQQKRKPGKR